MKKIFTSIKAQLIIIFIIAIIIRLTVLCIAMSDQAKFKTPDSSDYLALSNQLVTTGEYNHGSEAEIFRVPGYPVFLALLRLIFGENVLSIIIIQIIIGTATCLLTWQLAQKIFANRYISLIATLCQACSVVAIVFNVKILSETIFTFFMLIGLLLIELLIASNKKSVAHKSLWLAIGAGCAIALCSLCRAIILPIIPILCGYILWRCHNWKFTVLFALPVIIVFLGWSMRNYLVADFPGYSSVSSINLYRYNACALLAKQNNKTFAAQQQKCDAELSKYSSQRTRAEFAKQAGTKVILNNLVSYSIIHLKSDINNLLPASGELFNIAGAEVGDNGTLAVINSAGIVAGIKHYFKGKWWLIFIATPMIIFLGLIYLLSFIAAIKVTIKHPKQRWVILLYVTIIAWFLLVPGPASHPRFRVPVSPLLAILAAAGGVYSYQYYKIRKNISSSRA